LTTGCFALVSPLGDGRGWLFVFCISNPILISKSKITRNNSCRKNLN
jgi:hypothetical protein